MLRRLTRCRLIGILLVAVILLTCLPLQAVLAADSYPLATTDEEVAGALDYLRGQQGADGKISDFATSAWVVMAIAAAGEDPHEWKVGAGPSIVDFLAAGSASAGSVNDYSRMILAISAAGEDPQDFGGRDFVSLLVSAYDGTQIGDSSLVNDDFWAVMALTAAGEAPGSEVIQSTKAFILDNQNTDGGWSWGAGQPSDVDDTAAAIMALTAAGHPAASTELSDALLYLKGMQLANGGFESWGATNSATNSWAVCSITSAGQSPVSAQWKSGEGNDPVDDLLAFQNADGSFNWTQAAPSNKALMTAYAIPALLGKPYPVAVLEPAPDTVTISVRIEGQSATVWSGAVTVASATLIDDQGGEHYLDRPTALGALHEASLAGSFSYVLKDSAYGLYIYSIDGEEPAGFSGWTYRVDYYSPMVGASDFVLKETMPPAVPHGEVLFAYSQWGEKPLKIEVDSVSPGVGDTFTVTVTEYNDAGATWSAAANATVHADRNYTTGADGTVAVTIDSDMTVSVYAEKDGCIRSSRIAVTVGAGTVQPPRSGTVNMTANIIPAISFSVSPDSIDFGMLGPDDSSAPKTITLTNLGAWKLRITAEVEDAAGGLYEEGLKLDGVRWNVFETAVSRDGSTDCAAVLTVPADYQSIGDQAGVLVFWAADGRP
ncbi:MAG: hypothetical protein IBX68_06950 [Dehalococcoidia bacterium]|nr:hypothetical protein [Dehalococcoidia bacterium]